MWGSRNPLTGKHLLQRIPWHNHFEALTPSQSPYGEASFATEAIEEQLKRVDLYVAIPLRGSIFCNESRRVEEGCLARMGCRNPLTGKHLLQPGWAAPSTARPSTGVAIPLRGSISCNTTAPAPYVCTILQSRNPLTGKHLLQLVGVAEPRAPYPHQSQSPYGEASLATLNVFTSPATTSILGRNPLTGKHLLQRQPLKSNVLEGMLQRGVSEKDEAWNMHMPYKGHF